MNKNSPEHCFGLFAFSELLTFCIILASRARFASPTLPRLTKVMHTLM
jgi:hypothetical protein